MDVGVAESLGLVAAGEIGHRVVVDLVVIFAGAAVVALIMQRLRLAVIPAYLITGALIGPKALGLVPTPEGLDAIGHLAIVLLLFGIGLELHLGALKHALARMILIGAASCAITTLIGFPIAVWFGLSEPAGMVVSMAMSLSSTAVVLRLMAERRGLRRPSGRLSLAVLVLQDMAVIGMLACLPIIGDWAARAGDIVLPDAAAATQSVGISQIVSRAALRIGGAASLILLGRLVLPRLLRESLRGRSLEVMMVVSVAAALVAAGGAHYLGFSFEMGAFLAGFTLAATPFRHQISGQIAPLRDLFIALFFTTLGMRLDPTVLVNAWWIVLLATVVLFSVKSLGIGFSCYACGAMGGVAAAVGISLAQAGEFSLILLGQANTQGITNDYTTSVGIAVVVISLILTPSLVHLGGRIETKWRSVGSAPWVSPIKLPRESELQRGVGAGQAHIIVAGLGPIGKAVVDKLESEGISHTIIELNPETVSRESARGKSIVFGDAGNPEVLESAGIEHASALILTIPDEDAVVQACSTARRRAPNIFIAARAGTRLRHGAMVKSGPDHITVDELVSAADMVDAVGHHLRRSAAMRSARSESAPTGRY